MNFSQLSLYTDIVVLEGTERRFGKWSNTSIGEQLWDLKFFLSYSIILQVKKLSYSDSKCLAKVTQLLKYLEALEQGLSTNGVGKGKEGVKFAQNICTSAAPQGFSTF